MGDLGEAAAPYVRGGFTLFVGKLVSFMFLAVGSILVARMLTPAEYGLYAVCMVLPQFFALFTDWGINAALTRYVSRGNSEGRDYNMWNLNIVGIFFKLSVSGLLFLILFCSADFLSGIVLNRSDIGFLVRIASLFIIFSSLYSTTVAILTGLGRMDLVAVVNISEALVKGVSSPVLVYMGFGVLGSLIGLISSFIIASIIGVLLVVVSSTRTRIAGRVVMISFGSLGMMLNYGLPLFVGNIVAGFASRFQGFLLSLFVSDIEFGNYHVAMNFSSLVSLLTGSIAMTLFPAFSKLSYYSEYEKMREAFMGSIRYSSIIVVPAVFLFMVVSKPLVYFLYTARYPDAPFFLSLLLVPILLVGFGSISIDNFFNSQGDTRTSFRVGLVSSVVSIAISSVLVWIWGVFGLLVSLIVASFIKNVLSLYFLFKKYFLSIDVSHAVRLLICSAFSVGVAYIPIQVTPISIPIVSLFLSSVVFLVSFAIIAPLLGVLDEQDVSNLDTILSGIQILSFLVKPLIDVERWIVMILDSKKRRQGMDQDHA